MAESRDDLEKKLAALERTAVAGDGKAADKQRAEGKLTARERIEALLDPDSFVEEFMLAETQCTEFGMAERKQPSDGVVTGFGKIDGRPVYVFSQDRSILAGSVGSAHAEKIAYVIQTAFLSLVSMTPPEREFRRAFPLPLRSARSFSRTVLPPAASHRSRRLWVLVSAWAPIRRR
jgi:acetyl-CoA carboxylase carboxyltransferase component